LHNQENKDYLIGLDLGQAQDYTAIAVIEQAEGEEERKPFYRVRYLKRLPLGTPYPQVVKTVKEIHDTLTKQGIKRPYLIADSTGCGRPVFDMFRTAGLSPLGVNIHGGSSVTVDGFFFNVPKRDLVGVLQVLFQTGRLKVAEALPEAKIFVEELLNFRVRINLQTAHDSYEAWREGVHDDMVLAVGIACWYGETQKRHIQDVRPEKKQTKLPWPLRDDEPKGGWLEW